MNVLRSLKRVATIMRERDEARQAHDEVRTELTASEAECLRLTVENENLRRVGRD